MAITNGYITLADFKTYVGLTGSGQDTNIEKAIEAASREIDQFCGRFFYAYGSAEARTFQSKDRNYLNVPDISSTTGLVVKVDTTDDGTYDTTLTLNTDYTLAPINAGNELDGIQGYPYTCIEILANRTSERFHPEIQNDVQVTAKWGWSGIPDAIAQATFLQASRLWKRKDSPFNVFGNDVTGVIQLFSKFDPDAKQLITSFRKHRLSA